MIMCFSRIAQFSPKRCDFPWMLTHVQHLSKMSTLIGIPDSKITCKQEADFQTNKIGGSADCYPGLDFSPPICQVCSSQLYLVVQLYCPLDGSNYDRTLYIFGCATPSCWNKSESWAVYRSQLEVVPSQQTVTSPPGALNEDWGGDCDNWGSEDDDWGTSNDEMYHGEGNAFLTEKGNVIKEDTSLKEDHPEASNNVEDELPVETMCLEDIDDTDEMPKEMNHVTLENTPVIPVSDSLKSELLAKVAPSSGESVSRSSVLESYFINVFDESDITVDKDAHVNKLLKEYERREGQTVKGVVMEMDRTGGQESEKYERTSLKHGDVLFHRFMKQIALCPEQCIRYCWNGSPLYMTALTSQPSSRCSHCGGAVVFELQLMPALVNLLRFPTSPESAVEFGTVLIYTCVASCWTGNVGFKTEQVIVQGDPDQERYK